MSWNACFATRSTPSSPGWTAPIPLTAIGVLPGHAPLLAAEPRHPDRHGLIGDGAAVVRLYDATELSLEPSLNHQLPYLASAGMALVLLSAIGVAGMSRMMQPNVIATSGRAVEAAGASTRGVPVALLGGTGCRGDRGRDQGEGQQRGDNQ